MKKKSWKFDNQIAFSRRVIFFFELGKSFLNTWRELVMHGIYGTFVWQAEETFIMVWEKKL